MKIRGIEFESASDAIQYSEAAGGEPVFVAGVCLVVSARTLHRMERSGVEFAHLCDHKGHIVTVPVN